MRLVRVEDEETARDAVEYARKEHWNARHHCSAFVLGTSDLPGQVRRSNDDGEPSGTAGAPMLEALTGRGFVDCVAVVARYFGGVKTSRSSSSVRVSTLEKVRATLRRVSRMGHSHAESMWA